MINTFKVIAEYIWLDSSNKYRSKTRIFEHGEINESKIRFTGSYPKWSYDGSSCGDNRGLEHITECILEPHAIYNDPLNVDLSSIKYVLVLCRNYYYDNLDIDLNCFENDSINLLSDFSNGQYKLVPIHPDMEPSIWNDDNFKSQDFKLGFEQEFFMVDTKTKMPVGFYRPTTYCPFTFVILQIFRHLGITSGYLPVSGPQGPYYCGVGESRVKMRRFLDYVRGLFIKADINVTGFNYEVAPGQAEFQVFGPAIRACNDLLMLRYILQRTGEQYELDINFEPVVIGKEHGRFNMSGCHTNISFNSYRSLVFDVFNDNENSESSNNTENSNTTEKSGDDTNYLDNNNVVETTEPNDTTDETEENSANTSMNNDTSTDLTNVEQKPITTVQRFFNYVSILYMMEFIDDTERNYETVFGKNNKQRCHGELETSDWTEFSWGLGSRHTSVRIPINSFFDNTAGNTNSSSMYFEDRRPGSNVEPFTILKFWFDTVNFIFNNKVAPITENTIESQLSDAVSSPTTSSSTMTYPFGYLANMVGISKSKSD